MQLSLSDQRYASLPVSLGTEGLFTCKSMSTVFLIALLPFHVYVHTQTRSSLPFYPLRSLQCLFPLREPLPRHDGSM